MESFSTADLWRSAGIAKASGDEIAQNVQTTIVKTGEVSGEVLKYTALTAVLATGSPIAIALGIPALGLNIAKDISLSINSQNEAAEKMPTSVGGAIGMAPII